MHFIKDLNIMESVYYSIYITQIVGSNTPMFKMEIYMPFGYMVLNLIFQLNSVADWITYKKGKEVDGVVLFL